MYRQLKNSSKPSAVRKNPCLKPTMEKLFEKRGTTGDIKFMVDGEEIRAHRCVLAALSPRYEAQFYGALAETDTINVEDVSPGAFKEFLQFFYTDEVTLTLDNIEDVLNLAKQSLIDELVAECINYLVDLVGLDKIVWCYRVAMVYDIKWLEELCVKHINENVKTVFQSDDFLSCEHDMLCHILALPRLNCDETDAFDACISWAQAKCKQQGIDATDTVNLRAALGEALFKIQFNSMKSEEFAAIDRKWTGLLSAQESDEIAHSIATLASVKTLMTRQSSVEFSISNGPRDKIDLPLSFENKRILAVCDKPIELNGFVVCNRIEGDVSVAVYDGMEAKLTKCTKSISGDETIITLDKAIQISADKAFGIEIQSKELHKSDSNLYGFIVQDKIVRHGVTFEFLSTNQAKLNLISHLLFSIVNESQFM